MTAIDIIRHPSNRLDLVAGLIDGILNALTLAAGRLVHSGGEGATLDLSLRVSVAAGATTIFVFLWRIMHSFAWNWCGMNVN